MGFFGRKDHTTIHVDFYDAATKKAFAQAQMPVDRLPQSFESDTTMHILNEDWQVIEARPVTAAEFRRTGKLLLVMQKITIQRVDPKTILFSLPTITNDAVPPPAPGSSKLGKNVLEIHEDDWRQVEWVEASAGDAIAAEIESIQRIHDEQREESGFRNLHLRKAVPKPLSSGSIHVDQLRMHFGTAATWLDGFGLYGIAGIAADSFAVRLFSSIELYGTAHANSVQRICFANARANNASEPDIQNLVAFAAAHNVLLVDWCRVMVLQPEEREYKAYLDRVHG
jgi:hypothetical protein